MYVKLTKAVYESFDERRVWWSEDRKHVWTTMVHGGEDGSMGYITKNGEMQPITFSALRLQLSMWCREMIADDVLIHITPCHPVCVRTLYFNEIEDGICTDRRIQIEGNWIGSTWAWSFDDGLLIVDDYGVDRRMEYLRSRSKR